MISVTFCVGPDKKKIKLESSHVSYLLMVSLTDPDSLPSSP